MVVPLPFTVNLYHDGLFQVNPIEYVHFDNRVIDDVSFDVKASCLHLWEVDGYQLWYMQNDHNKLLAFYGRDVSDDKCAGLKGTKPKTVDDDECPNFLVCKQIRIGTVLKFDFLRSTCACKWLLGIMSTPTQCCDMESMRSLPVYDMFGIVEYMQNEHGYQLWYMQNDHNKLLAFYGRDVSDDKCAGLKGKKPKTADDDECETSKQGS
ncbi:hypothetical protein Tco_0512194 [Tanacetum coccineum]